MSTTYGTLIRNNVNYSYDTAESISCTSSNTLQTEIDNLSTRVVPSGGTSSTFLRSDGTWQVPPDTTYGIVSTASAGMAPSGGTSAQFLRADSTWNIPPNTTYSAMTSGTSGLAPQLPNESSTKKYLRGNATWNNPDTTYHVVDTVGNGLVPAGGTSTKYLRADGTWQIPTDHTYAVMTSGKSGLAPSGGTSATFLKGNATWDTPTDTTHTIATTATSGLVRVLSGSTANYFRGDGKWALPTDHTYPYMSPTVNGIALCQDGPNRYLAGDNIWRAITYSNENLKQTYSTSNADRRALLGYTTSNNTETNYVYKTSRLLINPTITYLYNGTSYFTAQAKLVRFWLAGWIYHNATQNTTIQSNTTGTDTEYYGIDIGVADSTWTFRGHADNRMKCGDGNLRWKVVYAKTGTINTSDRNQKENIVDLDETFCDDFIMDLKPVSYKFKNTSEESHHDRTHYGFIAQDVEETMTKFGMTALDFGGFCKDQKMEYHYEDPVPNPDGTYDEGPDGKPMRNMNLYPVEGEYIYGLRYEEFIAPIIKTIQARQKILDDMDEQIELIESRISALESA